MQTGPIFLTYRADDTLREIVASVKESEPAYDFTAPDGVVHRVWVISEEKKIAEIKKTFAAIPSLYIADGHHRAASAVKAGLRKRAMAVSLEAWLDLSLYQAS